jgi:hypothetical protein
MLILGPEDEGCMDPFSSGAILGLDVDVLMGTAKSGEGVTKEPSS